MKVSMSISGLSEAVAQIAITDLAIRKAVIKITNTHALEIQKGAKERCLVDSNRLRSSIKIQPVTDFATGTSLKVGTDVFYAPYVEFGTRHWAGKAFLFPAAEEVKPRFIAALREAGAGA